VVLTCNQGSLNTDKFCVQNWPNRRTDRDAPHPTHSEVESQTGSEKVQLPLKSHELEANSKLVSGSSLKEALDCDWDESEQRVQGLVLVLKVLSAVECQLDSQSNRRRSEVIWQYQQCQRILGKELGVQPAPETQKLFHMLLN
jgi:hypothetical protein